MKKTLLLSISITTYGQSVSILPDNMIESNTNTPLILKTNGLNRLNITNTGLVGIGTTTPQNLLHIHDASNALKSALKFTNTSTGTTSNDGLGLGYEVNSVNAKLFNLENGSLSFGTNNLESMNITSNGEVLINGNLAVGETLGNAYKLAVVGDTYLQGDVNVSSLIGVSTKPVHVTNEGKLIRGSTPSTTTTYTKYHNVSAANARLVGITAATNFTYMATACLAYLSTGVKYGDAKLVMPVEFPDGAKLNEITLNAIDNVGFSYLVAQLIKVPKTGTPSTESTIIEVNTDLLPLSTNVQAVSKSFNYTIENDTSYYYLLIDINSSGSNWGNIGLALRGMSFRYTITY